MCVCVCVYTNLKGIQEETSRSVDKGTDNGTDLVLLGTPNKVDNKSDRSETGHHIAIADGIQPMKAGPLYAR